MTNIMLRIRMNYRVAPKKNDLSVVGMYVCPSVNKSHFIPHLYCCKHANSRQNERR